MTVIAMPREMGTLGKDVAQGLADRLGLEVIHHELVERDLAERLHVGESEVHRFLEGGATLFERWKIDEQRLSRYTAEEILELASRDNVLIRGWGAANLLRKIPHVIRVRVCAPMHFRIPVIMKRLAITEEAVAIREIERNDAAHSRTIQRFFDAGWEDPLGYDIVLNTERVSVDQCVKIVCNLASDPRFQKTDESRAWLADKLVEARVKTVLERNMAPAAIDVTVESGKVTVSGATASRAVVENVGSWLSGVEGVTAVDNEIVLLNPAYST